MNRLILIIFFNILFSSAFSQDTIILQGHYYNKNLYIINPPVDSDTTFCVQKVIVNNQESKDELHSNSFEVDFSLLNIIPDTKIKILIIHNTSCNPKIVNPEVIQTQSIFSFVNIKTDKTGKIIWTIKGETYGSFIIEQYRWNKWVTAGEVENMDTLKKNTYAFEMKPHFGINQFKVSHTDEKGIVVYSKIIKYRQITIKEVFLTSSKVTENITFTGETAFEVFDEKGNFIMDGFGTQISVIDLPKGKYWLNYDNKTEIITKK